MSTRVENLQHWLNAHGANVAVDGVAGPATRAATIEVFRNKAAPAATATDIAALARRHSLNLRALRALAQVESDGAGWDNTGLLKCLYERHYLWRRIKLAVPVLSDPKPGGYTIDADKNGINDSWEKLAKATTRYGFNVAFECASFGKFQIMGAHWKALGYPSVADFVWGMSRGELAHYEAFARYIVTNKLRDALNMVDSNPENSRAIAAGYNGSGYVPGNYHHKIAMAWSRNV